MSKGFAITPGEEIDPAPLNTLRANVYHSIDAIMSRMSQGGSRGGAVIIEAVQSDEEGPLKFKLTFADVTDQKDCPFCGGTGIDGS